MKRKLLTACIVILLLLSLQSFGQIKYGIKGGVTFSDIKYDYKNSFSEIEPETKLKQGFTLGVVAQIGLGDMIAVQSGLMFTQKGTQGEYDNKDDYSKTTLNFIDVPLYATLTLLGFQLQAGPYFSMGISGKQKYDFKVLNSSLSYEGENKIKFVKEYNSNDAKEDEGYLKRFDTGLYFGLGYKLGPIKLNAGYQLGMTNLTPDVTDINFDPDDMSTKNRSMIITAAFIF